MCINRREKILIITVLLLSIKKKVKKMAKFEKKLGYCGFVNFPQNRWILYKISLFLPMVSKDNKYKEQKEKIIKKLCH